ncbi:hypothetical protein [uncultured Bilophila sp.]|uniref:hypothetical protein n=1 Tax=uncultured Bilophila sp. TaxID=529385 RepID=UPI00280AE0AC|nr:hypothetical protein [uncultured Bilophila sp.]
MRYAASLPVPRIQPYLDVPGTESFFCGGPPHCTTQALFKRCDVIKGGASSSPRRSFLFPSKSSIREAPPYRPPSGTGEERILWDSCNVNRSNHCALRVHVKDGVNTHVETGNTGDERYGIQQIRACPLGRSMRQRIHAEQRIPYPLYRVATGRKFERIRWEETFGEIGQGLRGTVDTYGNEAVHQNYGTGAIGSTIGKSRPPAATPVARLMNLVGGSRPLCGLLLQMELSLRRAAVCPRCARR